MPYIEPQITAKAKVTNIVDFLLSLGHEPVNKSGKELVYLSPIHQERSASFFVNERTNVFNDFGSGNKGDVIRLAMILLSCDFQTAILKLLNVEPCTRSFSFSGNEIKHTQSSLIEVLEVKDLENPYLLKYVASRGISFEIGSRYLKEVKYSNKGKNYRAVGFANNAGGYELRNGLGFKGKTKNGITVFDRATPEINLFEGCFDFLSALALYGQKPLSKTCIVLNSTANLNLCLSLVSDKINAFLDNDKAGNQSIEKLKKQGYQVTDWSKKLYPNHKDFNDFLLDRTSTIQQ